MISKKMEKALNEQVNAELYSAYLYLSMEAYFKSLNLNGFANWMRVQTQEEVAHAMKIYGFIDERGGRITLKAIEGPQTKWDSPLAVFKDIYKHEQVEEEASADQVVQQLIMMEKAPGGMFMLDRELAQRVFTPPATKGA